ncbi:MAG: hypothetical protein M3O50_14005, partial [Myxococcota bacterium]|nr:hypothetical protein [Myxococcota bacterium]
ARTGPASPAEGLDDGRSPSSLEDALIRELSEHWTDREGARPPAPDRPPIIDPSELRKRSSNPPPLQAAPAVEREAAYDGAEDGRRLHSIPSDAVVPASSSEDGLAAARAALPSGPAPAADRPRQAGAGDPAATPRLPSLTSRDATPPSSPRRARLGVLIAAALLVAAALFYALLHWTP